jgi:hypothetical protein
MINPQMPHVRILATVRGCDRFEFLRSFFPRLWVNKGKTVLAQILGGLGGEEFARCVRRYP